MNVKICVAGKICSGKSTLANQIARQVECPLVSFGGVIRHYSERNKLPFGRRDLQELGKQLIDQLGFEDFLEWIIKESSIDWSQPLVLDGLRHVKIYGHMAKKFPNTILVYCDCDEETQIVRLRTRDGICREIAKQIISHATESGVEDLRAIAHMVFQPHFVLDEFLREFKNLISRMRE